VSVTGEAAEQDWVARPSSDSRGRSPDSSSDLAFNAVPAPGRIYSYPLTLSPHRGVLRLKRALGALLCVLRPDAAAALRRGEGLWDLSLPQRAMLSALAHEAEQRGDLEPFVHRQLQQFWSSDGAADFHDDHQRHFEDHFLGEGLASLLAVERRIADGRFGTVCEIGCGHGRVIHYLSRRLTGARQFIGIDLSAEQVRRNAQRFPADNLRWIAGDAARWITSNGAPGWVFLTHNGVLEYFCRDDLQRLFGAISRRMRPAVISLHEPLALHHDLCRDLASRSFGQERSFSHNYLNLLSQAGFEIEHRSEHLTVSQRHVRIVAVAH
jgi:trans-aconitate methyltransferase